MWTSFAYDLDPNGHEGMCMVTWESRTRLTTIIVAELPSWPKYGKQPTNFVFRADKSYVEPDDDRKEGVDFINSIVR
jgi:acetylcholinesterase